MKTKYSIVLAVFLATVVLCFVPLSGINAQTTNIDALIAQLQQQVADLLAKIAQLQAQQQSTTPANTVPWCHTFDVNLGFAQSGSSEVDALHIALQKEGISYGADGINIYGDDTAAAVSQFQAKYGIFQTGYVGVQTRAKLNGNYGCANAFATSCQDGDYGKNYFIKSSAYTCSGTSCNQNSGFDACVDSSTLKEYYCEGTQLKSENYTCPNGCLNGACTSTQPSIQIVAPNGGEGWAQGAFQRISWITSNIPASNTVDILLQDEAGTSIPLSSVANTYAPSVPHSSENSLIIPLTVAAGKYKIKLETSVGGQTYSDISDDYFNLVFSAYSDCTDSDNGRDYSTKGRATVSSGGPNRYTYVEDACVNNSTLKEIYCTGAQLMEQNYVCPNGCLNGACVQLGRTSIAVVSPNGGEILSPGESYRISWTATGLRGSNVNILITSYDANGNATSGLQSIAITPASDSFYNWTPGGTPLYLISSDTVKYKITVKEVTTSSTPVEDSSDEFFSILTKPLAHYTFDIDARDSSGNVYSGSAVGAQLVDGKFNMAYAFDGQGDWIMINDPDTYKGNNSSSPLALGTNGITLNAWIKTSANTSGFNGIIRRGLPWATSYQSHEYALLMTGGNLKLVFGDGTNYSALDGGLVNDNQWHMVTGVLRPDNTMEIYVDGVKKATGTKTTGKLNYTIADLLIGALEMNTYSFEGFIDEVKIFKYGLSSSDIQKLYPGAPPAIQPSITVNLTANGSDGPIVPVQSGSTVNLAWTSTNATSCAMSSSPADTNLAGSWAANIPLSGTLPVTPTQLITYTVTCSNTSGRSFNSITLDVLTSTQSTITVTSPNGGEAWKVGETHTITWSSNYPYNGYLVALASSSNILEGGTNYPGLVSAKSLYTTNDPNQKSFTWTIGSDIPISSDYKIIVLANYINPDQTVPKDSSDNYFSIGEQQTGLLAHYNFDVNASDDTGNGYNGLVKNGVALADGKSGKAYQFDGINDYIIINGPNKNIGLALGNEITLSAWIKTDSTALGAIIKRGNNSAAVQNQEYALYINGGKIFMAIGDTVNYTRIEGGIVNDNQWHLVNGVLKSDNTMELWVDGVKTATGTKTSGKHNLYSIQTIGAFKVNSWYFKGLIDDVGIYNYALTGPAIRRLYLTQPAQSKIQTGAQTSLLDVMQSQIASLAEAIARLLKK